jgi:transcriptional regulator with XRE-family HTH domain
MSKIGKNIKKIRGVKKINQTDFANLFNISRASIGAYEEGRAEPKIETIIKISDHFKIPVDHLLKQDLQVNDIINFKLDKTNLDFSQNNLTSGRKVKLKEIPLLTKPNSKKKPDFIKIPITHPSKEYIAIVNDHISICYLSEKPELDLDKTVFIAFDNTFQISSLTMNANNISIKSSGENLPEGTKVYVVESEIKKTGPINSYSLEDRISRIETKLFGH